MSDSLNTNLSLINDSLYRLETFQMIQYTGENILLNYGTDMKEWIRFLQANLLEECTTYLCMVLYNCNYTYIMQSKQKIYFFVIYLMVL